MQKMKCKKEWLCIFLKNALVQIGGMSFRCESPQMRIFYQHIGPVFYSSYCTACICDNESI